MGTNFWHSDGGGEARVQVLGYPVLGHGVRIWRPFLDPPYEHGTLAASCVAGGSHSSLGAGMQSGLLGRNSTSGEPPHTLRRVGSRPETGDALLNPKPGGGPNPWALPEVEAGAVATRLDTSLITALG